MSKRKILSALKKKGITPVSVEYVRSNPVPEGNASGWDIEFGRNVDDAVYEINPKCGLDCFMELDDLKSVMDFIETIPNLNPPIVGIREYD